MLKLGGSGGVSGVGGGGAVCCPLPWASQHDICGQLSGSLFVYTSGYFWFTSDGPGAVWRAGRLGRSAAQRPARAEVQDAQVHLQFRPDFVPRAKNSR